MHACVSNACVRTCMRICVCVCVHTCIQVRRGDRTPDDGAVQVALRGARVDRSGRLRRQWRQLEHHGAVAEGIRFRLRGGRLQLCYCGSKRRAEAPKEERGLQKKSGGPLQGLYREVELGAQGLYRDVEPCPWRPGAPQVLASAKQRNLERQKIVRALGSAMPHDGPWSYELCGGGVSWAREVRAHPRAGPFLVHWWTSTFQHPGGRARRRRGDSGLV